jgi:hypothetical protein
MIRISENGGEKDVNIDRKKSFSVPMALSKSFSLLLIALAMLGLAACGKKDAPVDTAKDKAAADSAAKEKETLQTAIDAYVYAYPLVTMEYTRRAMTNTVEPQGTRAPMGQFVRLRTYPDASFKDVTAPNADTLYTQVWLDVAKEPWVVSIPDLNGRYALFPMLSGWTDVFQVPGKRTTGTGAQKYAITGPGWSGTLPAGVTEYKSPTGMVWLLGRIYCTGTPEDYKVVHALQDKVTAVPLSAYGKPYKPEPGTVDSSVDLKKSVRDRVHDLDGNAYFKLFAELLKTNPPAADDASMVAALAKIGIVAGQDFDAAKLDPAVGKAVAGAPKPAQEKIMGHFKQAGTFENGWIFTTKAGVYGVDYLQRALITAIGLGANRPQDAIYPTSETDAEGKPYSGANKYVVHFEKGQMPPVDGFWSMTMYNAEYFFVDNPLNRYNVSSRSKFKTNADGSVDVYIQNESPGKDKESNWLPAPKEKFVLMMRLYWPKEKAPSIIDGSWKIPPVKQASSESTK